MFIQRVYLPKGIWSERVYHPQIADTENSSNWVNYDLINIKYSGGKLWSKEPLCKCAHFGELELKSAKWGLFNY